MRTSFSEKARGCLLAAALLALASCGPISLSEEAQLGHNFAQEMRKELPILHDRVINDYVREMGRDIVTAAGPQPFDYSFSVVVDPEINAFAGPAGHIYIHTETILQARNASELAGVIGHEIGHVIERHVAENYNRQRNTQIGQQILVAGAGIAGGGGMANLANFGSSLAAMAYLNTFGREAEMEADAFAVETLPKAGWDPAGLVTFFQLLQSEKGGAGAPSFLSSHPATSERIRATSEALEVVKLPPGARRDDGGRLQIIQRRIILLTRQQQPRY
ncbi:MAG: M48 family metallopeptidase [Myxococcota bacterium]